MCVIVSPFSSGLTALRRSSQCTGVFGRLWAKVAHASSPKSTAPIALNGFSTTRFMDLSAKLHDTKPASTSKTEGSWSPDLLNSVIELLPLLGG